MTKKDKIRNEHIRGTTILNVASVQSVLCRNTREQKIQEEGGQTYGGRMLIRKTYTRMMGQAWDNEEERSSNKLVYLKIVYVVSSLICM